MLAEQGIGTELDDHLRAMRAACHAFLGWFVDSAAPRTLYFPSGNGLRDYRLNQALGQIRAVFGFSHCPNRRKVRARRRIAAVATNLTLRSRLIWTAHKGNQSSTYATWAISRSVSENP
jgi:hypothetical protein